MRSTVYYWSIVVALGGFLFGFDTAVISGAEQSIQDLWKLSDGLHGLAVAIALYGTVLGALFAGIPADKLGRKNTLIWVAILYFISALGSAVASDPYIFMFFRFIGGVGVGASSVVAPMYISEIAPAKNRGSLVALFQFNIVLGILIAYVSNYLLAGISPDAWRWMVGVEALPAGLFFLLVLKVPKSPRWLIIRKNDLQQARKIFEISGHDSPDQAVQAVLSGSSDPKKKDVKKKYLWSKAYRFPLMLAFLFAFFNQVSGINAIIYYAPRIFSMTGLGTESALLSTSGIGLINLLFTMLGMVLIDNFGRRKLMLIGSVGLIVSLGLVANAFFTDSFALVPAYLFIYIAFFAMSQGAVIWVFISEIFPNKVRAYGQSFGSFTHWILAAIIANTFPWFVNMFNGGYIFMFFSLMMFLQLLFVIFVMPETKGKSLEELEGKVVVN